MKIYLEQFERCYLTTVKAFTLEVNNLREQFDEFSECSDEDIKNKIISNDFSEKVQYFIKNCFEETKAKSEFISDVENFQVTACGSNDEALEKFSCDIWKYGYPERPNGCDYQFLENLPQF